MHLCLHRYVIPINHYIRLEILTLHPRKSYFVPHHQILSLTPHHALYTMLLSSLVSEGTNQPIRSTALQISLLPLNYLCINNALHQQPTSPPTYLPLNANNIHLLTHPSYQISLFTTPQPFMPHLTSLNAPIQEVYV